MTHVVHLFIAVVWQHDSAPSLVLAWTISLTLRKLYLPVRCALHCTVRDMLGNMHWRTGREMSARGAQLMS